MFEFTANLNGTNEIMDLSDNCYVSFNSRPGGGITVFESDHGGPETALVIDGEFFILNGDFREDFVAAASRDIASCVDVFENNLDAMSSWTTSSDQVEFMRARMKKYLAKMGGGPDA